MLEAIKKLGEIKMEEEGRNVNEPLSILIQDPNKDEKCPKAAVVVFTKKDDGSLQYKEINIEDVSSSKLEKYLYRRDASQGPDFTLSSKITEVEKFYKNKIKSWFKKYSNRNEFFAELGKTFQKYENIIIEDLKKKYEEIKKKNQVCLFTLAIEEKGELKYIGDYEEFKSFFIDIATEKYKRIKEKHICSICGEEKEVYGDALSQVFKFYTLDKPGYIAGGFREELAWRNAPICLDCILKLEEGKKYLEEILNNKLGGHKYYLIPKFMIEKDENINEIIKTFFRKCPSLKYEEKKDEEEILEELGNLPDVLTYNFLFFTSPNPQVFKIELHIEDVLPSRIYKIINTKKEVEKIFVNVKIKKDKYQNIKFSFEMLRKFIPSQKFYFEILYKIFKNENINRELIFSWFMNEIRKKFIEESYLKLLGLEAFITFLFLQKLNILSPKIEYQEKGGEFMSDLEKSMENFFEKYRYSDTFSLPAHKAIFLLGALTQKLLDIQYRERKATPFRKHLKGLRMNEEDILGLFPKVINKLEEYSKNYYRDLEALISNYFCKAGRGWKMSVDEINFYFVLGMSLVEKILEDLKLEEKEEKNA